MKFKREFMQRLVWEDISPEEGEVICDDIVDTSRWSINNRVIFKVEDKFYESYYSTGATEMQDEQPYEYNGELIECPEVCPVETTSITYIKVDKKEK